MQVFDAVGGEGDGAGEGAGDAPENAEATAAGAAESQPGNGSGGNGEGTAPEAGADAGAGEGEALPGAEGSEPGEGGEGGEGEPAGDGEQAPDPLAALSERFDRLEKLLTGKGEGGEGEEGAEEEAPAPRELSDEEWAGLEDRTGMSRAAHQHVAGLVRHGLAKMEAKIDKLLGENVAPLTTDRVIAQVATEKGFADAKVLTPQINEYLKKFSPKWRSKPELIRDAVIYARGMKATEVRAKGNQKGEINRKLGSTHRPAGPQGSGAPKKGAIQLTPMQKAAAKNMPGGEAEYSRILAQKNKNGAFVVE